MTYARSEISLARFRPKKILGSSGFVPPQNTASATRPVFMDLLGRAIRPDRQKCVRVKRFGHLSFEHTVYFVFCHRSFACSDWNPESGSKTTLAMDTLQYFYFPLATVAAVKALYELIAAPFYWEKTQHGLDKTKIDRS